VAGVLRKEVLILQPVTVLAERVHVAGGRLAARGQQKSSVRKGHHVYRPERPRLDLRSSLGGKDAITRDSSVSRSMTKTSPSFVGATICAGTGADGVVAASDEDPTGLSLDCVPPQPARTSAARRPATAGPGRAFTPRL
jgi:hypothetical protein